MTELTSSNFSFLRSYERQPDRLGVLAERYFADDPNTRLIKLRQFSEEFGRQTAARWPLAQADLWYRFNRRFDLAAMLLRLGAAAAHTPPMPNRLLRLAELC